MIYVHRRDVPDVINLDDKSSLGARELENAVKHFKSFDRDFEFKVYKESAVKKVLQEMFHDKCAFCESVITVITHEDVEHFRPKTAIKIGHQLSYPGYYWLGMNWDNLLLSCPRCNRSHKKNHFPLADESMRMRSYDDTNVEEPLLINPCDENPNLHLNYSDAGEVIYITQKGEISIKYYGLHRRELTKARGEVALDVRNKIKQIKGYLKAINFFEMYSQDPSSKERIEESVENLLIAFDYVNEYFVNPSKPYRALVEQLATEFIDTYGDLIKELRKQYNNSMRAPVTT